MSHALLATNSVYFPAKTQVQGAARTTMPDYSGLQDLCNKKSDENRRMRIISIQNDCERTRMCGFRRNFCCPKILQVISEVASFRGEVAMHISRVQVANTHKSGRHNNNQVIVNSFKGSTAIEPHADCVK